MIESRGRLTDKLSPIDKFHAYHMTIFTGLNWWTYHQVYISRHCNRWSWYARFYPSISVKCPNPLLFQVWIFTLCIFQHLPLQKLTKEHSISSIFGQNENHDVGNSIVSCICRMCHMYGRCTMIPVSLLFWFYLNLQLAQYSSFLCLVASVETDLVVELLGNINKVQDTAWYEVT